MQPSLILILGHCHTAPQISLDLPPFAIRLLAAAIAICIYRVTGLDNAPPQSSLRCLYMRQVKAAAVRVQDPGGSNALSNAQQRCAGDRILVAETIYRRVQ